MKTISPSKKPSGFGLTEVLVVIAVIGILASMAIPAFAGLLDRGQGAKDLRNAQSLVTTFAAARSAGATFTTLTKEAICEAIGSEHSTGIQGRGVFATATFHVAMNATELERALAYLEATGTGETFNLSIKKS